ncbi:YtxH domain-containing protein [Arcticibacter sp. MXS-1]|uniref:YtxH domain-containing protein n=1 Tax=Arcticibacter sp. MXS-1 TaxID=3341726 RepID=UPI0035A84827
MSNQSKIIAALLAGVAVGAVIGLLFSPDSGEENREDFAGWVKDLYDSSKEKAGEFAEKSMNAVKSRRSPGMHGFSDDVEKTLGV